MRALLVVVNSPGFNLAPRVGQVSEDVGVEALIAQACIKRLDVAVVYGLAGSNEVQLDAVCECP